MEEIINHLNMGREELIKFLKEFISELEDADYSSEDELYSSEDELEEDVIDEEIKVKTDEKGFLSLDLEFKSSTISKDERK